MDGRDFAKGFLTMTETKSIVDKAWNFAHVLRDDGLSYMAYTEQITFLLFLKMADEQSKPPYNKKIGVPKEFNWASLLERDGEELERHYRKILDELGKKSGMLGASGCERQGASRRFVALRIPAASAVPLTRLAS